MSVHVFVLVSDHPPLSLRSAGSRPLLAHAAQRERAVARLRLRQMPLGRHAASWLALLEAFGLEGRLGAVDIAIGAQAVGELPCRGHAYASRARRLGEKLPRARPEQRKPPACDAGTAQRQPRAPPFRLGAGGEHQALETSPHRLMIEAG